MLLILYLFIASRGGGLYAAKTGWIRSYYHLKIIRSEQVSKESGRIHSYYDLPVRTSQYRDGLDIKL